MQKGFFLQTVLIVKGLLHIVVDKDIRMPVGTVALDAGWRSSRAEVRDPEMLQKKKDHSTNDRFSKLKIASTKFR